MIDPTLAGTKLDRYFHVCAFFNSRDEEYGVMNPFYKEAEEHGEQMLHIVAPTHKRDHLERLAAAGIDTEKCGGCGQLQVLGWEDAYLNEKGAFEQQRMLDTVQKVFAAGKSAGFPRLRIMGNMDWAFAGEIPGSDELLEYEARVNDVLAQHRQPAVCVYDLAKLSASMMMDVLRTHPLTLVGGVVHQNPFYASPEQLLPELAARREERAASKAR